MSARDCGHSKGSHYLRGDGVWVCSICKQPCICKIRISERVKSL